MELNEQAKKMLGESLKSIYSMKENEAELQAKVDEYQSKIDELKAGIKKLDGEIGKLSEGVLSAMNGGGILVFESGDLVASKMSRSTIGYKDEAKTLAFLKENFSNLVNVKESINKKELNKEVKTNKALADGLVPFTETNTTEYVVVTTKENTEKMMQHINESKAAKAD